jgi:hypothetical protein
MADTILKNSTFQYQEKDGTPVSIEVRLIEKTKGFKDVFLDNSRESRIRIETKTVWLDLGATEEKIETKNNIQPDEMYYKYDQECLKQFQKELWEKSNNDSIVLSDLFPYFGYQSGGEFYKFNPTSRQFEYSLLIPDNFLDFKTVVQSIGVSLGINIDLPKLNSNSIYVLHWKIDNYSATLFKHIVDKAYQYKLESLNIQETGVLLNYPNNIDLLNSMILFMRGNVWLNKSAYR